MTPYRPPTLETPQRLQSVWNRLWLGWRNRLQWQRAAYHEPPEPKSDLFTGRPDAESLLEREADLLARYDLANLHRQAGRLRYLESLTFLSHAEALLPFDSPVWEVPTPLTWLDVGAKNWGYVDGLYALLKARRGSAFELTGLELDGWRIYHDFHSRADYARAYIADKPEARYLVGDVLQHTDTYDVVSCFLPFVFLEPCLAWGLPAEAFQPVRFLQHMAQRVNPGGVLLLVNQDATEAQEQAHLLQTLQHAMPDITLQWQGALPPSLMPSRYTRQGWRIKP